MRRRKLPRVVRPHAIVASYFGEIREMLRHTSAHVGERLTPEVLGRLADATAGVHHDGPPMHRVNRVIRQAQDAFDRRFPLERISRIATKVAKQTSDHQGRQLKRQLEAHGEMGSELAVSLDRVAAQGLKTGIRQFTAENVALIQDVPRTFLWQTQNALLEGIRDGDRAGEIADTIEERTGVAENRAKLIARDQVGKFMADLNQVRQQKLGITRFIWRGANDEREREWHSEREGQEYDWDEGVPEDELEDSDAGDSSFPGQAINCRCTAEPVIESAFEDEESGESDEDVE